MKRILMFVMAAVLLTGAAAPGEVRAEGDLTVFEVLDQLGVPYSENITGYSELSSYSNFMFYSLYDSEGNLVKNVLYLLSRVPNGWNLGNYYYLTMNGYAMGNWGGSIFFFDDMGLVRYVPSPGQPNSSTLYTSGGSSIDIIYSSYDTGFLSSCPLFTDIVNDELVPIPEPTPTNTPTSTPTPSPSPTSPPDPELMSRTGDFSFVVIMMMLLMQDFPLNFLLVGWFILAAIFVFRDLKGGMKK